MIVAGSASPLLLASAGGYNLTRSLRFRSSASAYLNRTPASAGNRQIWTYSTWIKRGSLGSQQDIFISGSNVSSNLSFQNSFNSSDNFLIYASLSGVSNDIVLQTTQVFRDPSAWYHIIIAVDTTQATSSNRVKLYINGNQVTSFSTATYPTQNYSTSTNNTVAHTIGRFTNVSANYFDGYMAETHLIDGQALTPSSFGANSPTTGVWQPKKYAGTYGTNGFYLPFTNNSTTTTLGNDFSGNGNNWTTNNISLTAGSTYDSMTDVPTLTSATAANFAVMNPLDKSSNVAISNANLTTAWGSSSIANIRGTFALPTTGKYYWEALFSGTSQGSVGVAADNMPLGSVASGTYISYAESGLKYVNGSSSAYGSTYGSGDLIGIAYDADASQLTFYKNNTSQGAISLTANTTYFPLAVHYNTTINHNFGQRPFTYTPPTGFVALNTFNLPTPTIGATASTQANKYFDISLYSATGSTPQTITNSGFQPDMVWTKPRSSVGENAINDSVRGSSKLLITSSTGAEATDAQYLTSFNSNGYSLGTNNWSATTVVGWQWRAGGTAVSNTAGSITSTVSANTSAGFSVVTYTGTGSAATVGHGLGVAPRMIICKARSSTGDWVTYHASTGAGNALFLNLTDASTATTAAWNNTSPTSTVFSVAASPNSNPSGVTVVAYCFSEISGYSKFGSYTGNGSADAPFIYLGFKPKFILIRRTDTISGWKIYNTSNLNYNPINTALEPHDSGAEATGTGFNMDLVSNGIKLRTSYGDFNSSGNNFIYMAFAETPFKYSLAR